MFADIFTSESRRLAEQARIEKQNFEKAITVDQFLENIGNRNINDLRSQYTDPNNKSIDFGFLKLDRPKYTTEDFRYVQDPRYPGRYIDMDHFLGHADLGNPYADDIGVIVEIQQWVKRLCCKNYENLV